MPTPSIINNPPTSTHHTSHRGAIIGGTLAGLAFLASIVAFLLYCRNKRKKSHLVSDITPSGQTRGSGNINIATSKDRRYMEVPEGEAVGPIQKPRVPSSPQHRPMHDLIANITGSKNDFSQDGYRGMGIFLPY
ncbi:hypothetical protein BDZ94DRAFT_1254841 [Collybia nuda]|uniref:Uncharacterized protein n=1 Tax=Collybia nuda TaxID=64659 RepID=A0A9P5YAP3_9AGAR|nr:hypothetical protein BDZ94DRAFT_1254841 [Collybia nuda]